MANWFAEAVEDEVPFEEIQKRADNEEFHKWNFEPQDFQENGYEDVIDELKKYTAVDYLKLKEKAENAGEDALAVSEHIPYSVFFRNGYYGRDIEMYRLQGFLGR